MLYLDYFFLGLFGEGGDGGAGNATGDGASAQTAQEQTGVSAPDAGVQKGRRSKAERLADVQAKLAQEQAAAAPKEPEPEPEEDFESLIKGKFKDQFGQKVQSIIQSRFPQNKANEDRLKSYSPMMDVLASKYGIQRGEDGKLDEKAIIKAVIDDDDNLAEEAAEHGYSVESWRHLKELEAYKATREAEDEQKKVEEARQQEEAQKYQDYLRVVGQVEKAKQFYPDYDLNKEMDNPAFARLIGVGVDAKTAYEVIHKDEIMVQGMAYAAQTAAEKVTNSVIANGRRPQENGLGSAATANVNVNVPMDKSYRDAIKKRALRGEKVIL